MKIGIDARFYNQAGIGRYLRNLIASLQEIDSTNQYYIFLLKDEFDLLKLAKNFKKVLADFKWYGFDEQRKLPKLLSQYKLDLVHFPHFNVPVFYKGKFIVTIHDLIHSDFKMRRASAHSFLIYELKQQIYKKVMQHALKKSQKIIVPSNFVKEEIVSRWDLDQKKITITSEAVEENILKISANVSLGKQHKILQNFAIKQPYIFYVGNAHPHKNVEGLIEAFLALRKNYQSLQLVLSGNDHYFWQRIKGKFSDKNIIYTGFVSDEELVSLYKNAQCFVLPSFSEGFGIPLLEAMACGCPVVSSNKTALPEIGGDAALYFNPNNVVEISEKIQLILNDQKLRQQLKTKGTARYKQFSWEALAKETKKIYDS